MSAFVACRGLRLRVLPAVAIVLAIALPRLALATEPVPEQTVATEPVTIHIDKARILKLPERTATLVVGNPLIADAVVQPGGIVVVTGKSYGATNLVAIDRAGNTLMQQSLEVVGPDDKVVVIYRGTLRETVSCSQNCEPRITIGDAPAMFTGALTQVGTINSLAMQQMQAQQR
jgi:Flp pilus assembly secretin CpaC